MLAKALQKEQFPATWRFETTGGSREKHFSQHNNLEVTYVQHKKIYNNHSAKKNATKLHWSRCTSEQQARCAGAAQ